MSVANFLITVFGLVMSVFVLYVSCAAYFNLQQLSDQLQETVVLIVVLCGAES